MKKDTVAVHDPQSEQQKLAIEGGKPVRTEPLPLEFPGVHHMGDEEVEAAVRLLHSRSLFRYYGVDPQKQVGALESEFAQFLGASHAIAVTSGTGALETALAAGRTAGVHRTYLEVRPSNTGAIAFYRRHEFVPAGRRPRYYTDPEEDAMVFSRELV